MSIAIHYTSINPPLGQGREIFGLQVAIADWVRAYLRYGRAERFSFLIGENAEWEEIRAIAASAGVDESRLVALDRRFPEQNLAQFSTVFRAEPDTRNLLWQRQLGGSFSFCGLAHAISGTEAGIVLQDYCLSSSTDADAIICPSRAVQSAIRSFWDSYGDYLRTKFGVEYRCPVQLPVIPLGIDVDKFTAKNTPEKRAMQRAVLGIGENEIVLLWVGRLSAAIKAHPIAMFQAAERAAEISGAKVRLVMQGYFVPQEAAAQFAALAADVCSKATVSFIAADDARFPDGVWAAGDIFLSLVDNLQESFGLTPIEAMAAGLPRVISDWDGYRDSVTDSEDGFLIRTMQPPGGHGSDLVARVLSGREVYGGFLAKAALTVAVDAEQAGQRLATLIADKNLRLSMVEKAHARVRAVYDWRRIIPAYEELWAELAARKKKEIRPLAWPILPDPYTMYEKYPTRCLKEEDQILLALSLEQTQKILRHEINLYAHDVMIAVEDLTAVLHWLVGAEKVTIAAVFRQFPQLDRARLWRTLAWLQKLGVVRNWAC